VAAVRGSGFSHLYTVGTDGKAQAAAAASGKSSPVLSADGKGFYFLCNQRTPMTTKSARSTRHRQVRELTSSTAWRTSRCRRTAAAAGALLLGLPAAQLAVLPATGGKATPLTDTRTADYKARSGSSRSWCRCRPSMAPAVWAKYYGPARKEPGKKYPIVMFVHGAGYLQNVDTYYPAYFREQMFHNLLVQKGYIVLDMDYRGSAGYGRDWRTAIYRNMGHPELEDYKDGLDWLVDTSRATAPCRHLRRQLRRLHDLHGAVPRARHVQGRRRAAPGGRLDALQPRVHQQHPQHAGHRPGSLQALLADRIRRRPADRLLIAHGMIDDNVFFQDSVDMTQKLIELHKDNWQIAPYPLERHGFVRPDSWLDEYKRVLKLFDETLKPAP
jgi:dipeptidyl aminopeptidase/acylaminoacyl peptidase